MCGRKNLYVWKSVVTNPNNDAKSEAVAHSGFPFVLQYPLPAPIIVRLEALGSITPAQIETLDCQLHFPCLVEDGRPVLRQPEIFDHLCVEPTYSDGKIWRQSILSRPGGTRRPGVPALERRPP